MRPIVEHRCPIVDLGELRRLIKAAGNYGAADDYAGKRTGTRFAAGLLLDVTTDPADSSAVWPGQLHNISEGGFSFWSKRQVEYRAIVYIREFSPDGSGVWVPGQVIHCTLGIRGYLVGTRVRHKTRWGRVVPAP